ncbi:methyl-accepting chemotaxis protein [Pseudoduganella flava]|uniref:Methyl-accepting chemotaxis protein n=1 Tax=Pseudoduganella flava TaxID=871742 RepID=A0A562PL33_9BURK|nr:methyl-accepting chemotaxis protein [Pseudoduganella flava]QGZ42211.1 methyl-accepting chemotaxis protein [Pseudoduganella flava]TWI44746.1 methyl-accepting chemotaxis protein [Pseudoduganella flava]
MKSLTFKQKLWIPLICSLLCITAIFLFEAIQIRQTRIDERKQDLTNIVETALSGVKMYADQAQAGKISQDEAKKLAIDLLRHQRYGKDGYLSIVSGDGVSVMNPTKPEAEGKNVLDFQDKKGNYLYRDIVAAGHSAAGAGFAEYWWARPGGSETVPKLSRAAAYRPWDWIVITGVYMDDIDAAFRVTLAKSAGVLLVVCAILAAIVGVINRSLQRTIGGDPGYAEAIVTSIAAGDLSVHVDTAANDRGSVLYGMKTMQENLARTIGEIRRSAETIATASAQIATGNMDLSARTESQASALEETAASMEELTSTVNQNAQNAREANSLVQHASSVAQQGGQVVSQVVSTMETISASSKKVVDIISVIDSIAFQTNILALNAAVEAARAGEQGRGFAVVAAEVRNLAQRSAAAAKEIKELINNSVDSISAGSTLVAQAGSTMNDVVDSVARVTQIMASIADASSEQSTGIGHVNEAITSMDTVTQQNAALVEEAAAAAASMQEQAARLAELVASFTLDEAPAQPRVGGALRRLAA